MATVEADPTLRSRWRRAWLGGPFSLPNCANRRSEFGGAVYAAMQCRGAILVVWCQAGRRSASPLRLLRLEGERGVGLQPVAKDAIDGPYFQHQLVRVYLLVGEPGRALDRREPLLGLPYDLSPGWLRIDPNFQALRGNPRFERLVKGS